MDPLDFHKIIKAVILTLDTPDKNNITYSTEAMQNAVQSFQSTKTTLLAKRALPIIPIGKLPIGKGPIFEEPPIIEEPPVIEDKTLDQVEDIYIEDDKVIAQIRIVDDDLYNSVITGKLVFRPYGVGKLHDHVVTDYTFEGISVVPAVEVE